MLPLPMPSRCSSSRFFRPAARTALRSTWRSCLRSCSDMGSLLLRRILRLTVRFDREAHLHLVPEQGAAGIEDAVPDDAVLLAIEGEGRLEAGLLALRSLHRAEDHHRNRDRLRHAVESQVTHHVQGGRVPGGYFGAGEGERGEFL